VSLDFKNKSKHFSIKYLRITQWSCQGEGVSWYKTKIWLDSKIKGIEWGLIHLSKEFKIKDLVHQGESPNWDLEVHSTLPNYNKSRLQKSVKQEKWVGRVSKVCNNSKALLLFRRFNSKSSSLLHLNTGTYKPRTGTWVSTVPAATSRLQRDACKALASLRSNKRWTSSSWDSNLVTESRATTGLTWARSHSQRSFPSSVFGTSRTTHAWTSKTRSTLLSRKRGRGWSTTGRIRYSPITCRRLMSRRGRRLYYLNRLRCPHRMGLPCPKAWSLTKFSAKSWAWNLNKRELKLVSLSKKWQIERSLADSLL